MAEKRSDSPTSGAVDPASPQVLRRLAGLIRRLDSPQADLEAGLVGLAEEFGDLVYSELIYLLAHLRFASGEARDHWRRISLRRGEMEEALGSGVDLRVALVSYFVEVSRQLENPTVIEMRLLEQTEALAYRDELTGLRNFRFFKEFLRRELPRSDRYGDPASLIVLDVDDFKGYNDSYGHEAGNRALAEIGRLLSKAVRTVDLVARYGGEEFVLVAPSTPKLGARTLAEQIRRRIEEAFAEHGRSWAGGKLTASLGVATYPADGASEKELMRSADRALYLAKSQGKNQVQLYARSQRSFRRVELDLEGWLSAPKGAESRMRTLDVSVSGLRFVTGIEVPLGALVEVRMAPPGCDRELQLVGRSVQSRAHGEEWETAIHFLGMRPRDRRLLARLVRERENVTG